MHSPKNAPEECPECGGESTLQKMITNFSTRIDYTADADNVGDVVKENINQFKQELKDEKKRLSRREYDI